MEDNIYKITLADGTILNDLRLNGNNFISTYPIDADTFAYNCAPVVITTDGVDDVHENMELIQVTQMNDKYWFVLRDIPVAELTRIKMQSDIEYIAMMAGIEL